MLGNCEALALLVGLPGPVYYALTCAVNGLSGPFERQDRFLSYLRSYARAFSQPIQELSPTSFSFSIGDDVIIEATLRLATERKKEVEFAWRKEATFVDRDMRWSCKLGLVWNRKQYPERFDTYPICAESQQLWLTRPLDFFEGVQQVLSGNISFAFPPDVKQSVYTQYLI